jgi:transaldolase
MTRSTATVLWNDSADPQELAQGLDWGVVGATCNPVIALACIRADLPRWSARILELAEERPTATQNEIGWAVVEEVSIDAARLLEPAFEASGGINGRLSMQTDPTLYRDAKALADQAEHFAGLAPNIIVKIPAIEQGIAAIEDATYRGVNINVTVSFTVSQAVTAGEAIERGLRRREAEGLEVSTMGPVVTIMVGRLDDWMKDHAKALGVTMDPGYYEWAGVAAFKKAYQVFAERGLRSRLLSAAFRNHMHWSEFIGGDVVISPPFGFQKLFNTSGIEATPRIHEPVGTHIVETLYEKLPDFRRAYDVDGMSVPEFIEFGATRKTLRQFLAANAELEALVRDVMLPAP